MNFGKTRGHYECKKIMLLPETIENHEKQCTRKLQGLPPHECDCDRSIFFFLKSQLRYYISNFSSGTRNY